MMCLVSDCATTSSPHDNFDEYCSDHREIPGAMEGVILDIELHSHGGIDRKYVQTLLDELHEVTDQRKEPGSIGWRFMR